MGHEALMSRLMVLGMEDMMMPEIEECDLRVIGAGTRQAGWGLYRRQPSSE